MAETKFEDIYLNLKNDIVNDKYHLDQRLPSEHELASIYDCTRNTIRKATRLLNEEGIVYSAKGKGVFILKPIEKNIVAFKNSNFEGLSTISRDIEDQKIDTQVYSLKEMVVDHQLSQIIEFDEGEVVYESIRIRLKKDKAIMYDRAYFSKEIVGELDETIISGSIYRHLKENQYIKIAASRTFNKVLGVNELDTKLLSLGDYNCIGEFINIVYDDYGRIFEHTFTHYVPNEHVLVSFNINKN